MLSRVSPSNLNHCLKATSNAVRIKQPGPPVVTVYNTEPSSAIPNLRKCPLSYSSQDLTNGLVAISNCVFQKRLSHTDIKIPDYTNYKKRSKNDLIKNDNKSKNFTYLTTFSFGVGSAIFAKTFVRDVVGFLNPSSDVLALSKIEVNLSDIPLGKNFIVKWREKPLFIKHRTPEEIKREESTDLSILRDPQHDSARVKNPEWLVVLGICTHLGCIPISGAGDFPGGYFCPCHGSHYDGSGRIRKGPAPLNLEVPPYTINGDILVVG